MLRLADLRSFPSLGETLSMLQPGLPLAFCVAAMMTTVVTATNLASGQPQTSHFSAHFQNDGARAAWFADNIPLPMKLTKPSTGSSSWQTIDPAEPTAQITRFPALNSTLEASASASELEFEFEFRALFLSSNAEGIRHCKEVCRMDARVQWLCCGRVGNCGSGWPHHYQTDHRFLPGHARNLQHGLSDSGCLQSGQGAVLSLAVQHHLYLMHILSCYLSRQPGSSRNSSSNEASTLQTFHKLNS